jgi:deoxyribose-phosphate aldolase
MKEGPVPVPVPPVPRHPRDLAPLLEHSVLRADATEADVAQACSEARTHGFAAVCVRPRWVGEAARRLAGSDVKVVAVVDFPDGRGTTPARAEEARRAVAAGAREVDVVLPLAPLRARDHRAVLLDLASVVSAAGVPVKVILETCRLSRDEKVAACALAQAAGASWVKTSTGFAEGGATEEDVALLRATVGPGTGVKASGGIRTADQALCMARAGADRIGTSASVRIVEGIVGP